LNYLNANFSNVPPTNWTLTSDQAASGTTATWSKSGYALVQTDAVDQEEWLISPSFAITAANTYTISFDYLQTYTTYGTNDLSLYISFDNGVTWIQLQQMLIWFGERVQMVHPTGLLECYRNFRYYFSR
jgi:hypothetical protein